MSQPLRITSDGSTSGTKVFVGDEQLKSVQTVSYYFAVGEAKPTVTITVKHAELDLLAPDAQVITDSIEEE